MFHIIKQTRKRNTFLLRLIFSFFFFFLRDSQTKKSIVSTVIIGTAVCTQHCGLQSRVGQYHIPEFNFHFQIWWKKRSKMICNPGSIELHKNPIASKFDLGFKAQVPLQRIPTFATWTFAPSPTWLRAKKVTDGSMLFLCSREINVCIASDYSRSHKGILLLSPRLAPAPARSRRRLRQSGCVGECQRRLGLLSNVRTAPEARRGVKNSHASRSKALLSSATRSGHRSARGLSQSASRGRGSVTSPACWARG